MNWQWTSAGQTIWAQQGYRPVLASVAKQFASKFPTPPQLFTIDFLGGWTSVKKTFFDPSTRVDHEDRAGGRSAHCLQLTVSMSTSTSGYAATAPTAARPPPHAAGGAQRRAGPRAVARST